MKLHSNPLLADQMSAFLITQQVVGFCTVVSNCGKTLYDLIERVGLCGTIRCYHQMKNMDEDERTKLPNDKTIEDVRQRLSSQTHDGQALNDLKRENFERLKQHARYIGIGILRMTPIAGTIYSGIQWHKGRQLAKFNDLIIGI